MMKPHDTQSSTVDTPAGGVMTVEVGAITGRVTITTTTTAGGTSVTIGYEAAVDTYTVQGSPVKAAITHEAVVTQLTTDPGRGPDGNPAWVDLTGHHLP